MQSGIFSFVLTFFPCKLLSSSLFVSYYVLFHSFLQIGCASIGKTLEHGSTFPIAIRNGTCLFPNCNKCTMCIRSDIVYILLHKYAYTTKLTNYCYYINWLISRQQQACLKENLFSHEGLSTHPVFLFAGS